MKFTGKTCVITGGANGIGRCLTEKFCGEGAAVAFSDVDGEGGRALAASLADKGMSAHFFEGDMALERPLKDFCAYSARALHGVDIIIHNACISKKGILSGCTFDDFNKTLALGATAAYMLALHLLPHMKQGAAMVNISSTRALMSQPDTESYSAAKGALSALTHALAVSLAGRVRVNAVFPGWIDTSAYQKEGGSPAHETADRLQHPCGRVGKPEDIAALCMFLCGEESSFITGQDFVADGGMTRQMIYHNDFGWALDPAGRVI